MLWHTNFLASKSLFVLLIVTIISHLFVVDTFVSTIVIGLLTQSTKANAGVEPQKFGAFE